MVMSPGHRPLLLRWVLQESCHQQDLSFRHWPPELVDLVVEREKYMRFCWFVNLTAKREVWFEAQ